MGLPTNICVADDGEPDAEARLTRELYAGLPVPVRYLEREGGEQPAWLVVARRPDGATWPA